MKIQEKTSDICKEVLTVLSMCEEELLEKIPIETFEKLKDSAADSNIEVFIDPEKDLLDQNISEKSKDLISLIYIQHIANENEKKEIQKILSENEKKYNKELNLKVNHTMFFEEKREVEPNIPDLSEENKSLEEYHESFFQKLKVFVSKILKIIS